MRFSKRFNNRDGKMKHINKITVLIITFCVMFISTSYSVCNGGVIILDRVYYDGLSPYSVYNYNLMGWGNVYYSGQRSYIIRNGDLMGWGNPYYNKRKSWGRYDINKRSKNNDSPKNGGDNGCGGYNSNGLNDKNNEGSSSSYSKHRNYKQSSKNNFQGGPHDVYRRSHRHRPSKYRFLSR